MSVVSSECLRNGGPDEKLEQKNTWSRCALILLKLHKLMIVMRINFKKMNFGQLILMKVIETAGTRQHILKLKCTKFDFGWGLVRGKRSFGLHTRRYACSPLVKTAISANHPRTYPRCIYHHPVAGRQRIGLKDEYFSVDNR